MAIAYAPRALGGPLDRGTLLPDGWDVAHVITVADLSQVDQSRNVEIEISPAFTTLSAFGHQDVIGNVPSIASQLDQAAQSYGSRVYAVVLEHQNVFDLFGVSVDQYRFVIYHTQFPALLILVALPVVIGMVAVWLECHGQPLDQCGQMLQANAHDAAQSLCDIFGASCALNAFAKTLGIFALLGIGFAGVLYFTERRIALTEGVTPPKLPPIRAPRPPEPRLSVQAPGLGGIGVSASSGGRGRRRGGG